MMSVFLERSRISKNSRQCCCVRESDELGVTFDDRPLKKVASIDSGIVDQLKSILVRKHKSVGPPLLTKLSKHRVVRLLFISCLFFR